jgi:hypothetical protein
VGPRKLWTRTPATNLSGPRCSPCAANVLPLSSGIMDPRKFAPTDFRCHGIRATLTSVTLSCSALAALPPIDYGRTTKQCGVNCADDSIAATAGLSAGPHPNCATVPCALGPAAAVHGCAVRAPGPTPQAQRIATTVGLFLLSVPGRAAAAGATVAQEARWVPESKAERSPPVSQSS